MSKQYNMEDFKSTTYTYEFLQRLKELDPDIKKVYDRNIVDNTSEIMLPIVISPNGLYKEIHKIFNESIDKYPENDPGDVAVCTLVSDTYSNKPKYSVINL